MWDKYSNLSVSSHLNQPSKWHVQASINIYIVLKYSITSPPLPVIYLTWISILSTVIWLMSINVVVLAVFKAALVFCFVLSFSYSVTIIMTDTCSCVLILMFICSYVPLQQKVVLSSTLYQIYLICKTYLTIQTENVSKMCLQWVRHIIFWILIYSGHY